MQAHIPKGRGGRNVVNLTSLVGVGVVNALYINKGERVHTLTLALPTIPTSSFFLTLCLPIIPRLMPILMSLRTTQWRSMLILPPGNGFTSYPNRRTKRFVV